MEACSRYRELARFQGAGLVQDRQGRTVGWDPSEAHIPEVDRDRAAAANPQVEEGVHPNSQGEPT